MTSRLALVAALLCGFALGLATFHPVAAAVEGFATWNCGSAAPCGQGLNAGKGPGVYGSSKRGFGILGATLFNAASKRQAKAGVWGEDSSSTSGFNEGVLGTSNKGAGVIGTSNVGAGVRGVVGTMSTPNPGPSTPAGVQGYDNSNSGGAVGVLGESANGGGVAGTSSSGYGTAGVTKSGPAAVFAISGATATGSAALAAQAEHGAAIFSGFGASSSNVTIDSTANIITTGHVFTSGSCHTGCVVSTRVRSYGTTAAVPTMEDTGEAQLANGAAYVRVDPAFANAIDTQQAYVVLITPEGDARGMFVTQRTPAGFMVRESAGGRSNAPFAYRIVAHPYGAREARLPFVRTQPRPAMAP